MRIWLDTARGINLPPDQRSQALLFQEQRLFPHLNVRDNVRYGLRRRTGKLNRGSLEDVDEILQVLQVADLLDRYPSQLSGGQQQRVALARTLAAQPKLLLLDEPLTSVERSLRSEIAQAIKQRVTTRQIRQLLPAMIGN